MSPPTPVLGITQIARRLGLTRQRAHKLAERGDFPTPVHDLPTGRLWRKGDVERWIEAHPRYDHSDGAPPRCPTCGQVTA